MFTPISNDPLIRNEIFDRTLEGRKYVVSRLVEKLIENSNFDGQLSGVTFNSDLFNVVPAASSNYIFLPLLFLYSLQEIEPKLDNLKSLEEFDSMVESDPMLLQRFADNLADLCEMQKPIVDVEARERIRLIVRYLLEKPDLAEDGIKFTILHELGHVQHKHAISKIPGKKKWIAISAFIALAVTFAIAVAISATVFSALIALPVSLVLVLIAAKCTSIFLSIKHNKKQESEADDFAKKALQGVEGETLRKGGIYVFETTQRHQIALRDNKKLPLKERLLFKIAFSPAGHNRFYYVSHPSETERIKNLQKP